MKKVTVDGTKDDYMPHEPKHMKKEQVGEDVSPVEEEPKKIPLFPEECIEPLNGLLFLGELQEEFEYAGHRFLLRTLREGDIIRIGQLCKAYADTIAEVNAKRLYTVSAAIVSVDGKPICEGYSEDYDAIYEASQVVRKWYPPVLTFLYENYAKLEGTAFEVAESLKK